MTCNNYNCIVILGPTATGKTSIATHLAYILQGEIISADSRQVYKGLDIGSGKDLEEYCIEGNKIHYHLIDITDLSHEYNVFNYQKDFYKLFPTIIERKKLPIVVGGTGLYLDAIIRNYKLVDIIEDKERRKELENKQIEELAKLLLELKPNLHNRSDLCDKQRCIRAIEIAESAAKKTNTENDSDILSPKIKPLIIGTTLERGELREKIKIRLIDRLNNGMIEEVENLHKSGYSWKRLEDLGLEYKFISEYLEGKIKTKEYMFEKLFIAIRQFAKRQETWFRGMERKGVKINWLPKIQDKNIRICAALEIIKKESVNLSI